jgi:uncharacterized membrane protein
VRSFAHRIQVDLARPDPFWPAQLAALAAILLYLALPEKLTIGPPWLVPAVEGLLFVALVLATPGDELRDRRMRQRLAVGVVGLLVGVSLAGIGLLVQVVAEGEAGGGRGLLEAAIVLWGTIVLVFALVYWELDRGGPVARADPNLIGPPDFLFAERPGRDEEKHEWRPTFLDYLYVALTNSTAFSPTDTLPLSRRAKVMMGIQAVASMVTVVVIIARGVNSLR